MKKKIHVKSYRRNGKKVKGYTKRVKKKSYELDMVDDYLIYPEESITKSYRKNWWVPEGKVNTSAKKTRKKAWIPSISTADRLSKQKYGKHYWDLSNSEKMNLDTDITIANEMVGKIRKYSPKKVRKSLLRHGDIEIFQPGPVPADRRLRSNYNIHHVGLSEEQERSNREAEKRLRKLMGY